MPPSDLRTPKQSKDILSDREYRSAVKGESWKFQLMSTITEVMKKAKSKKQLNGLTKTKSM